MNRRRALMAANTGSSGRIPAEYQEVEYISTTGTQFIWLKNAITTFKTDGWSCEITAQDNGMSANTSGGIFSHYSNEGWWIGLYGSIYTQNGASAANPRDISVYWDSDGMHTETSYRTHTTAYAGAVQGYNHLAIFAIPTSASAVNYKVKCKLFKLTVKKAGVLHWDFVPCYRKSDNVVGLYDLVTNTFFTNDGTGTFGKGADV